MSQMNTDPWTVFGYEVKMFFLTRREIAARGAPADDVGLVLKNALVESSLLHTRILADILLARGSAKDDIALSHLLPPGTASLRLTKTLANLKAAWGSRNQKGSVCWTINKMLAHPTFWRSDGYDYGAVANAVDAHIADAVEEIAVLTHRQGLLTFR